MSGINDFVVKFATVNGSGSASANTIFAKTLFRMGLAVSPKNIFPPISRGYRPGMRCACPMRATSPVATGST